MIIKTENALRFRQLFTTIFPLLICLLYLWMALTADLRLSVPEWCGISAVVMAVLVLAEFFCRKFRTEWSAGFILCIAFILRIMFVWRSPELSDDIYRYVFDGLRLLSGHNPYAAAPLALLPKNPLLAGLIGQINHPGLPTIYPPAAQLVFAAGAAIGGVFGMKLLFILLDVFTCAMILRLLKRLGRPRHNAILYAWHPLPVIEIAGAGHIDAAAIFFLFASIFLLLAEKVDQPRKTDPPVPALSIFSRPAMSGWTAGILFSAAVMTKWMPLIFLPGIMMLAAPGKRRYAAFGFIISAIAMIGSFLPDVQNCFHTLSIYVQNWEFSGFAFRQLRHLSGSGKLARMLMGAAFIMITGLIYLMYIKASNRNSRAVLRSSGRNQIHPHQGIFSAFYAIAMTFLFLTPTLHPWYALYLAVFLPFAAGPSGFILSWSVLLAYRVVIRYGITGQWIENDLIPLLIVSGPMLAYVAGFLIRRVFRPSKASEKSL